MREIDRIWIDCAARLGVPVARGGDAYVHWDTRTLHIADDAELDADDTVAQLVLHEICHWLVEGEAARQVADWGLDNTDDRDADRERAAVRLQAHLTGGHGLRGALFPTTVVRAFFESLPHDALGRPGAADPSVAMAHAAAARAARRPFRDPLAEALAATAAALDLARHRVSGRALAGAGDPRTCGGCAWRTDGGFCRVAGSRHPVADGEPACAAHEPALDCFACAACCRDAFDSVTVGARDLVRKRHPALVVDRGSYREIRRDGDHCAALDGALRCTIYDDRPRTCRDFAVAGRHCLTARRRLGLTT